MTWVGAFGAMVCYLGSFFGRLAASWYSNELFFRGWGWNLILRCAWLLLSHLAGYAWYSCGLLALGLLLRLHARTPRDIAPSKRGSRGLLGAFFGPPYPGCRAVRLAAGAMLLPYLPPFIALTAGLAVPAMGLVAMLAYGLVSLFGRGLPLYLWIRLAVRHGVRDAQWPAKR